MKINIKFWITIILASLAIIFLKSFKYNFKKDYFFERNITKNNFLKPIQLSILDSIKSHDFIIATDHIVTTYERDLDQNDFCNIKQYDLNKNRIIKKFKTTLPSGSISFTKGDHLFYIDKFQLFSKNIATSKISSVSKPSIKIFNAFPLSNTNEYIILGETKVNNQTKVVFIKYNSENNTSIIVKEINKIDKDASFNFLINNGIFSKNSNHITYTLNKSSNVFIFDRNGNFVSQIKTKENVPDPEIVQFNGISGYKRDATYNTNIATFIKDDYVYVLSERTNEQKRILIDQYSLKNGDYNKSFSLDEISCGNKNINNIFQIDNLVIFNLTSQFKSFVF